MTTRFPRGSMYTEQTHFRLPVGSNAVRIGCLRRGRRVVEPPDTPFRPAGGRDARGSCSCPSPIDWRLLDGAYPDDREEWLDLVHSDASILFQRDGEPFDVLVRGPVSGGHMTSMSTYMPASVKALRAMALGPGLS
ncbi:hypothetical protein [Streptomyces sp. NPDC058486]|uniref:hypothetical protein n=1 Tax=unclassified Streptomyces TaxID=2593676 RepID=UPI00365BEEC0